MNTETLKEYLGMVMDLEKHVFLQEKMIGRMQYEAERLSKPTELQKPKEPKEPEKDLPPKQPSNVFSGMMSAAFGGAILGFFATPFLLAILGMSGATFFYFLIPVIVAVVFAYKDYTSTQGKYQRSVYEYTATEREKERKYEQAKASYQRALSDSILAHKKSEQKREDMLAFWNEELVRTQAIYEGTKNKLRTAYAKNIIFPKYRNLTMVASIYEYLCAGRCTTLDGHEGAYNILETEIRLDQIIVQLDRVIANLEKIQQNQYMLYSAIQESNAQSARLLESTDRMAEQLQAMQSQNALQGEALTAQIKELQKSSELTAYHTERTQKELAYMNRMDYLTGRNDGPFRNVPPT